MMSTKVITAQDLTMRFGSFTAVDAITFSVKKGEIFGFLGANGAGKTTAIKMLTGLLSPSGGEASVAGFDIKKEAEKLRERIGYMSQKFSLYEDLTLYENIRFFGGIYGLSLQEINEKARALLSRLELTQMRDMKVASLPLGWKQKLAFSVALIHEPEIIFLDEPTGGVDPVTRRRFWDMIYQEASGGTTIFVTTHYMDEAEYCDRLSIMVDGKIAALDTPQAMKQHFGVNTMEDVFIEVVT